MLLLDGVDGHHHVSHVELLAGWDGSRSNVVETVVSVEVHEGVCESDSIYAGVVRFLQLKIVKQVVDGLDTFFGAEKSSGAVD